jgi:hypothetical protein
VIGATLAVRQSVALPSARRVEDGDTTTIRIELDE